MHISPEVKKRFPGLKIVAYQVSGVRFSSGSDYVSQLETQVKDYLNDTPEFFDSDIIKEYNLYGSRSCGNESKVSRLAKSLIKGEFPENNDIVDIVNLMQIYEGVVSSVYDFEKIDGEMRIGIGEKGAKFNCGSEQLELTGRELVLYDEEKMLGIVPCYDSHKVYVDKETNEILIIVYGNSSTTRGQLIDAITSIVQRVLYVSGGKISSMIYLD